MSGREDPPESEPESSATAGTAPRRSLQLLPPQAKGHTSVVRLPNFWYVACLSRELKRKPISRTVLGIPLVLFRDGSGRASALLDRCPHRNVPLSLGSVQEGQLECAYHGWRFDGEGACRAVPSLCGDPVSRGRNAPSYPTIEQDGCVWIYATPGEMPESRPFKFQHIGEKGYATAWSVQHAEATMHATIENALDVPHTAFLHRGLFRSKSRGIEIQAVVKRGADRVEAEYIGEPRPPGFAARLLSPSGGMVTHYDRFILPCIAQVEYRLGKENHFLVSSVMTPVSDFYTRVFAVVSFKLRFPSWLIRPFITPIALKIFQQDALVLRTQSDVIRRFGGEQFVSTEIDVMGKHIWRLLKGAERSEVFPREEAVVDTVKLVV